VVYDIISVRHRKAISVKHPEDIFDVIKKYAKRSKQELFLVITLDSTHQMIGVHIATIGLINRTIIHPREVFIHAVRDMASSIAIAHNHPSGKIMPSSEDEKITRRIKEASDIMGFYFLDHIIFSKDNFFSFRREHSIFRDEVL